MKLAWAIQIHGAKSGAVVMGTVYTDIYKADQEIIDLQIMAKGNGISFSLIPVHIDESELKKS